LRVVAEMVTGAVENATYFPSYEIITGPQARGQYYADDLREVTPAGVSHVMSIFKRHYLSTDRVKPRPVPVAQPLNEVRMERDKLRIAESYQVVCDEEILDA
jgi:GSCFA family protein